MDMYKALSFIVLLGRGSAFHTGNYAGADYHQVAVCVLLRRWGHLTLLDL